MPRKTKVVLKRVKPAYNKWYYLMRNLGCTMHEALELMKEFGDYKKALKFGKKIYGKAL